MTRGNKMIMPIGIIEQSTEDSAIFTLTRPEDRSTLKINARVMVWNAHRDDEDVPSGVMVWGHIAEIGATTATFKTDEISTGPYYPKDADPLAPGSFVYLALSNFFEVDRSQIATREEEKFLHKLEQARQLKEVRDRNDSRSP